MPSIRVGGAGSGAAPFLQARSTWSTRPSASPLVVGLDDKVIISRGSEAGPFEPFFEEARYASAAARAGGLDSSPEEARFAYSQRRPIKAAPAQPPPPLFASLQAQPPPPLFASLQAQPPPPLFASLQAQPPPPLFASLPAQPPPPMFASLPAQPPPPMFASLPAQTPPPLFTTLALSAPPIVAASLWAAPPPMHALWTPQPRTLFAPSFAPAQGWASWAPMAPPLPPPLPPAPQLARQRAALAAQTCDCAGSFPLHASAAIGDIALADVLVRLGAPLNARNRSGETALIIAARGGFDVLARAFIDAGADVFVCAEDGTTAWTASMSASNAGRLPLTVAAIKRLLDVPVWR